MRSEELQAYGTILIFIALAILFLVVTLFLSKLIHPHKPNEEKLSPYESGEEASGQAWVKFNSRFYIVALLFLLFEVEIVFIIPWSVVMGNPSLQEATQGMWSWFVLGEMMLFIFVLFLGLLYAWKKGYLDWIKPTTASEPFTSPVPKEMYERLNEKYAHRKS
ncbi:MAG: NADH-quinone oxidoreductase subunit A [Cytophagaceae bacterium]|nr:NADH-quinone oxidoreductase subunit A [Cytophagaceae bacterium]MDW8455820.1 NADH-quinone oxidoreductase subunit A [Cytophagaceae bacterium]